MVADPTDVYDGSGSQKVAGIRGANRMYRDRFIHLEPTWSVFDLCAAPAGCLSVKQYH
jgi:hypothetical protein